MNLTTQSSNESWSTTTTSSDAAPARSDDAPVLRVVGDYTVTRTDGSQLNVTCVGFCPAAPLAKHVDIDALVAEFSRESPEGMREARRWVSEEFFPEDVNTLAGLRRAKNLSQAELAAKIGSTQPYVAKIEGGSTNLQVTTLRRLCEVLEVDMNTLDRALRATLLANPA